MTDTVTNAMWQHRYGRSRFPNFFLGSCPLLTSLTTLSYLVFMTTDFTVAVAVEHEINRPYIAINETTRPDDTRPRPQCLEAEAEAEAIGIEAKASFLASRPRPVRGLNIPAPRGDMAI